jgi:8-oxo-dGTP diphosphatase
MAVTPVLIRAAGGVVWRAAAGSTTEVLLVHRPRYDDWSLPKGKLDAGETAVAAAIREVEEETGVRAAVQAALPPVRYHVRGVPKVVEYWTMRVLAQEAFQPNSEVDDLRWAPPAAAARLLSYAHDAKLLSAFTPVSGVVVLLRHASAGQRGSWPGPDRARPLDAIGLAQASALARVLALFGPVRLVSAAPRRCVATLSPLASRLALPVEVAPVFNEDGEPGPAAERIRALAAAKVSTVVCSQRGLIPATLGLLRGDGERLATAKGAGWVLPFAGDRLLAPQPLPA